VCGCRRPTECARPCGAERLSSCLLQLRATARQQPAQALICLPPTPHPLARSLHIAPQCPASHQLRERHPYRARPACCPPPASLTRPPRCPHRRPLPLTYGTAALPPGRGTGPAAPAAPSATRPAPASRAAAGRPETEGGEEAVRAGCGTGVTPGAGLRRERHMEGAGWGRAEAGGRAARSSP
jgi:hypothetical protein